MKKTQEHYLCDFNKCTARLEESDRSLSNWVFINATQQGSSGGSCVYHFCQEHGRQMAQVLGKARAGA